MSDLSALREFAVKQRSNIPSGGNHPEHGNELLRVIDRIQHQILSDDKFSKRRNSGNLNFVLRITIRLIIQGVNSSFQRINPTSGCCGKTFFVRNVMKNCLNILQCLLRNNDCVFHKSRFLRIWEKLHRPEDTCPHQSPLCLSESLL